MTRTYLLILFLMVLLLLLSRDVFPADPPPLVSREACDTVRAQCSFEQIKKHAAMLRRLPPDAPRVDLGPVSTDELKARCRMLLDLCK